MARARAVRLDSVPPDDLRALLEAERIDWLERLEWDPGNAAEVTAQAIECGLVEGAALFDGSRAVAHVALQSAGGIARPCSVHVPPSADAGGVRALVRLALAGVRPDVRLEGQLAAFEAQHALDAAFQAEGCVVEERRYLARRLGRISQDAANVAGLRQFRGADLSGAAAVLIAAHDGGVESRINEAFRTASGAVGYLVEVAGGAACAGLQDDASWVVEHDGRLVGFCLGTEISRGVGHVPQIAVDPSRQSEGLGALLLHRSLSAFARAGCRKVTLSVSVANARACEWYSRQGFELVTRFSAYYRESA